MGVEEKALLSIILKVIANNIARRGCGVCCSKSIHAGKWIYYKPGLVSFLTTLMGGQRLKHIQTLPGEWKSLKERTASMGTIFQKIIMRPTRKESTAQELWCSCSRELFSQVGGKVQRSQ